MEHQENIVRKIINNEVAQVVGIAVAIWFFVIKVIIPINNIQISLTNIQTALADMKQTNADFNTRITDNTSDIIRLQSTLTRYNFK